MKKQKESKGFRVKAKKQKQNGRARKEEAVSQQDTSVKKL